MSNVITRIFGCILATLVFSATAFSQITVTFTDGGMVTIPCGDPNTFTDGFGGTYAPNMSDTLVICSDGVDGLAVSLVFASETGGYWDIHESDTLYVYDGPDTSAPLLGAYNNGNQQFGTLSVNSTIDNQSGCLTLVFVSDGANEAQGFSGETGCFFQCQPLDVVISSVPAILPAAPDTGTIDICLGDTVWLTAGANFPLSSSNGGAGYNQTLANSEVEWIIAGGATINGLSGYFVPQVEAGYYVDLLITDTLGCFEYARTKVRVATSPRYFEMATVLDDTICFGETAIILGGLNTVLNDTVGVDPTTGEFIIGGLFADQLQLPDGGNGTLSDVYSTTITISGAEPTDSITYGEEVVNICVDIEHSYLGDLEMWIVCPNGDSALIFDGYNEWASPDGFFPGGFPTQTGINLGIPGIGSNVGDCYNYCFSMTNATFGSFEDEYTSMTTQMDAGTYLPEQSFDELIGCPINGAWNLRVADNFGGDDGWICQWSIELADSLTPEPEYYTPYIVDGWWDNDPLITNLGDTAIEVTPPSPGDFPFTFNVSDNYGCEHDTTVLINVVPVLESFSSVDTCALTYNLPGADDPISGEWTYTGPTGEAANFVNQLAYETAVTVTEYGSYQFIFEFDNSRCNEVDSVIVQFTPTPAPVSLLSETICPGTNLTFDAGNTNIGAEYTWNPTDSIGQILALDSITEDVTVTVVVENACGTETESADIVVNYFALTGPTDVCLDDVAAISVDNSFTGGTWTATGEGETTFSPDSLADAPDASVSVEGIYTFTYTDAFCNRDSSLEVQFVPAPIIDIATDTNRICVEDALLLIGSSNTDILDVFSWNPMSLTESDSLLIDATTFGLDPTSEAFADTSVSISLSASNFCGDAEVDTMVQFINCTLTLPSIFSPESDIEDNAYFNIEALHLHPGNNVKIFDRWGRKCYDEDNYHLNPWNGDGSSDGTYFYILERKGYDLEKGYVHLVKSGS